MVSVEVVTVAVVVVVAVLVPARALAGASWAVGMGMGVGLLPRLSGVLSGQEWLVVTRESYRIESSDISKFRNFNMLYEY